MAQLFTAYLFLCVHNQDALADQRDRYKTGTCSSSFAQRVKITKPSLNRYDLISLLSFHASPTSPCIQTGLSLPPTWCRSRTATVPSWSLDFQGPQKMEFLKYIGEGAHAHVFKVRILGQIYALKFASAFEAATARCQLTPV